MTKLAWRLWSTPKKSTVLALFFFLAILQHECQFRHCQKNIWMGRDLPLKARGQQTGPLTWNGCEVLCFGWIHKGIHGQEEAAGAFISTLPGPCVPWMGAAPASCRLLKVLCCAGMLMAQSKVAPAEAHHELPAPAFGSDCDTGFKVIQIICVHLISTQMFVILADNAEQQQYTSLEMCLWDPSFFHCFLITYNTLILLLKLSILVKMRAVFHMNLQNWSCVSLLALTHKSDLMCSSAGTALT